MTVRRATLVCAVVVASCAAPRYTTAPLGNYDTYRPSVRVTPSQALEIELERAGYVAVISIFAGSSNRNVPILFAPWYPAHAGEDSFLSAGRHRLRHVPPPDIPPPDCAVEEQPSLTGCRRPPWYYMPGMVPVMNPVIRNRSPQNHVLVVTQTPVDPYTLADDLYHAARSSETLDRALRAFDAAAAGPVLERALLERRGPVVIAGTYVTVRRE